LASATRTGTHSPPSPIGFYFANLWYFEKLYPVIYTVAALTRVANLMRRNESDS
jgi:squalene-hopene/tetraprenyl-beta-curcumene cyclase